MALANVIQSLTSFIQNKLSLFLTHIPTILLICSTLKRPGMSPIKTTGNIINELANKDFPVGANIDGSPNMMNQMYFTIVSQIMNAIKYDSRTEMAFPPGAMQMSGTGMSTAGPVTFYATNVAPVGGGMGVTQ